MTDDTSSESILDQLFNYMQSGLEWASDHFTKECPPKKKKICTEHKKVEEKIDIGPPCIEQQPYIPPSQICPKIVSCCYIKPQDPYAPCCCEVKPKPPPCPPKCHRRQREPTCGCDLCKKEGFSNKCCSSTTAFYDASTNPKHFRRA